MTATALPDTLDLPALLRDLHELRQHLACAGVSLPSSTGLVCDVIRVGVTGDGCSAHYREAGREMRTLPRPPATWPRFVELVSALDRGPTGYLLERLVYSVEVQDLSATPPRVAPLVAEVAGKSRTLSRTLAEWCAWTLADPTQRGLWLVALAKSPKQAHDSMAHRGSEALKTLAKEWLR